MLYNKSGWPSGLRRCVQVAVHFCGRGFESHFWQYFFVWKSSAHGNIQYICNMIHYKTKIQYNFSWRLTRFSMHIQYITILKYRRFHMHTIQYWNTNCRHATICNMHTIQYITIQFACRRQDSIDKQYNTILNYNVRRRHDLICMQYNTLRYQNKMFLQTTGFNTHTIQHNIKLQFSCWWQDSICIQYNLLQY